MNEKKSKVYDFCDEPDEILPFVWRGAFLAKICNVKIPGDTEVVCMSEDEQIQFSSEPYSDALAHLLIMYGAGYISFEKLSELSRDAAKYSEEIFSAERFIIRQSKNDEKNQVSREFIESIFLCTMNSKKFPEIQTVDFDMARSLCEGPYTTIRNGFVFVKDVGFLTLLANVGEPMGSLRGDALCVYKGEQFIHEFNGEKIDTVLNDKPKKDNGKELPDMPFLLNLINAYYIQEIYSKPYSVEFIAYAKSEGIPFDEKFSEAFDEYVRNNKLKVKVSAISRKRNICGNEVNWFDYGTTKYLDKKIVIDDKYDVTADIDLNGDVDKKVQIDDDVLIDKAMNKFIEENKPADQTVIEATFCGKIFVYLYDREKNRKILLNNDKFRKVDYENRKVIPVSFENSGSAVYQEFDISDGTPETMKAINSVLTFADDWMDEIDSQGFTAPGGDDVPEQSKNGMSR